MHKPSSCICSSTMTRLFLQQHLWLKQVLLGNLPVRALETFDWEQRVIVPDHALVEARYTRTVAKRRDVHKGVLLYQMELFEDMMFVPSSFGSDLCLYETREQAAVGQELAGLYLRMPSWRGIADYHENATLWQLLRLLPHHKTTRKRADSSLVQCGAP